MHDLLDSNDAMIARQIQNCVNVTVYFTDCSEEIIKLYKQDDNCYIKPLFVDAKKISQEKYNEIKNDCTRWDDTQMMSASLNSALTYDEFMNAYYN